MSEATEAETAAPATSLEATIIHGEALDVLRSLPTASVAGVVTDPPYSSGGQFRSDRVGGKTATEKYIKNQNKYEHDFGGDNRDQRSFLTWCALWMSEALRVTVPGGVIACFTDWRQLPTLTDAIQAGGWIWRGIIPWDKTEATRPMPARPRAQAEYAVIADKLDPNADDYNARARAARDAVIWGSAGPMDPRRAAPIMPGVIRCRVGRDKVHPTQKPVEMLRALMRIVARGGTVLDPFAGSGSHGAAALLEGHPYIGVEMSDAYARIARENIEATIAAHGLTAANLREIESRGGRVGGPTQVSLFDLEPSE